MVFSPTKMENVAQRGVLLKKHCWIICSSPREENDFFCNLTQNTLLTGVFLVLPKIHSLDARVSLDCRMHERKHFTESFNYLIQIQLTFSTKYAIVSSFSFSFSPSEHGNKQPIQNQIKFDWSWIFWTWRNCICVSTRIFPNPKLLSERVQPACRQSIMVHVPMIVACTALST